MKLNSKRGSAAVAASLIFLTGCGAVDAAAPASPSAATSGAVSGAASVAASGAADGAAASTAGLAAGCRTADAELRVVMKAFVTDTVQSAQDKGGNGHAALRKAIADYVTSARKQADAADPALGAALRGLADTLEKAGKASKPLADDEKALEAAATRLDEVCGPVLAPSAAAGAPVVRVGAAGSACPLPVSFEVPAGWKPERVDREKLGEAAALFEHGTFLAECVIDGKPAGALGNLRVEIDAKRTGTPRQHLAAYLAADSAEARAKGNVTVKSATYTDVTVGGVPATQLTYETYNKVMEMDSTRSALALNTPRGVVVVSAGAFGSDEFPSVLPAFELVKKSITVNP